MLTQDGFAALLQRYTAGQCTLVERDLLDRWLAQSAEPSPPELTQEELAHTRAVIWRGLEETTQAD